MARKLITFQDVDGSISSRAQAYLADYRKKHPGVAANLSGVLREAVIEGIAVMRARSAPRLEDKMKTGALRKNA